MTPADTNRHQPRGSEHISQDSGAAQGAAEELRGEEAPPKQEDELPRGEEAPPVADELPRSASGRPLGLALELGPGMMHHGCLAAPARSAESAPQLRLSLETRETPADKELKRPNGVVLAASHCARSLSPVEQARHQV